MYATDFDKMHPTKAKVRIGWNAEGNTLNDEKDSPLLYSVYKNKTTETAWALDTAI